MPLIWLARLRNHHFLFYRTNPLNIIVKTGCIFRKYLHFIGWGQNIRLNLIYRTNARMNPYTKILNSESTYRCIGPKYI
jgi:hypothetical protein